MSSLNYPMYFSPLMSSKVPTPSLESRTNSP